MGKWLLTFIFVSFGSVGFGFTPPDDSPDSVKPDRSSDTVELRMSKRFGVGISAAGPLSVLGAEVEFHINEDFSVSGGLGTGLDYATWMVKGKYFLSGQWVSPYFALGLARWWTDGTKENELGPSVLRNRFLTPGEDYTNGFSVFMVYPAVGVLFTHPSGFGVFLEGQYLFRLFSFANGTYAGTGVYWYF